MQLGDVIFIDGLKIILVDHYIKINNPGNLVSVLGLNSYKEIKKVESINPVSDDANGVVVADNRYRENGKISGGLVFDEDGVVVADNRENNK